jgi:hypothetical protein
MGELDGMIESFETNGVHERTPQAVDIFFTGNPLTSPRSESC